MKQQRAPKVHVLSDVDEVAHTATCAKCGPVRVQRRPRANGQVGWACREARRERRLANPQAWQGVRPITPAVRRRQVYRLSPVAYGAMVADQCGRCAICQQPLELVVDHDHATGEVRGLLCRRCNVGLGSFLDNATALRQAATYVEQDRPLTCRANPSATRRA